MTTTVTASAPGSTIITGEHAVVYGHPGIVCAIEARIHLRATRRDDGLLIVHSDIAAPQTLPVNPWAAPEGPYRFVLAAFERHHAKLPGGATVHIRSEIDPTMGLGSSAAVTVAALGAFARLAGSEVTGLHTPALQIVRAIQGRGSGADLAASLMGGMLAYRLPGDMLTTVPDRAAADITPLPVPPPLALGYCGYKTPTAEVLAQIADAMVGNEAAFDALYGRMGNCAAAAARAAQTQDWVAFSTALDAYQAMMEELGVCDETLARLVSQARRTDGVMGAKISGSGLGDCVLALGAVPEDFAPAPVAETGLTFHD
ncbi:MAG: mevalonate kinase [Pseudomonadota bacterium]